MVWKKEGEALADKHAYKVLHYLLEVRLWCCGM